MIIITNIPVNGRAGRKKGNIWMYVRGGGVTARERCGGVDPWHFFPWFQQKYEIHTDQM